MIRALVNFITWFLISGGAYACIMFPIALILSRLANDPASMMGFVVSITLGGAIGCGLGNGIMAAFMLRKG